MAKYPPYKITTDNKCVWTKSTIEQVLNSTKATIFKVSLSTRITNPRSATTKTSFSNITWKTKSTILSEYYQTKSQKETKITNTWSL